MAERREILLKVTADVGQLNKRLDEVVIDLQKNREALRDLNKAYKAGELTQEQYAIASNRLKQEGAELRKEQRELNRQLQLNTQATKAAEGSNEQLKAQLALLTREYNKLSREQRETTQSGQALGREIRSITEELKANESAVGDNRRNVGNYTQSIIEAVPGVGNLIGSLAGPAGLAFAVGAVGQALVDGAQAVEQIVTEFTKFRGQVQQLTGATGQAATEITADIEAIAQTFDKDFNEVLIAANAVSKQFGISVEDALAGVKQGFLAGSDATGEYLDILREYPAQLAAVGLGFNEANAIINQSVQSGLFSDKGIDAIKEAGLRLRELTPATRDALEGIGLSADEIERSLSEGSTTLFEVTQQVSQQLSVLPPQSKEVGAALADIFGGPGEDAGLQYLTTLKDINLNLDETIDESNQLTQVQRRQLQVEEDLATVKGELAERLGFISNGSETLGDTIQTVLLRALVSTIDATVALINYFIDLYNESIVFRSGVEQLKAQVVSAFDIISGAAKILVNNFKVIGQVIGAALKGDFDQIGNIIREGLSANVETIKQTGRDVATNYTEAVNNTIRGNKIEPIEFSFGTDERSFNDAEKTTLQKSQELAESIAKKFGMTFNEVLAQASEISQKTGVGTLEALAELNKQLQTKIKDDIDGTSDEIDKGVKKIAGSLDALNDQVSKLRAQIEAAAPDSPLLSGLTRQLLEAEEAARKAEQRIEDLRKRQQLQRAEEQGATIQAVEQAAPEEGKLEALRVDFVEQQLKREGQLIRESQAQFTKDYAQQTQKRIELAKQEASAREQSIQAVGQAFGQAASLAKEGSIAQKALAIGEATVNTYLAASRAFASAPPPFGAILAATTVATGLANVAKIAAIEFAGGGLVPELGPGRIRQSSNTRRTDRGDSVLALVKPGEAVLNAQQQAKVGFSNLAAAGVPGFATGGIILPDLGGIATAQQRSEISSQADQLAAFQSAIARMPAPVVGVVEFQRVKNRLDIKEQISSI